MIARYINRYFMSSQVSPAIQVAVYGAKEYDKIYFSKVLLTLPIKTPQIVFHYFEDSLNEKNTVLSSGCDTACIFVNDHANAEVLQRLKNFGVNTIALRCAGFNNVDLQAANQLGIKVVRVPAYSPHAVAEFTMGMLLTLNRKIHKAYNRTRDGNFALSGLLGSNLYGSTVGIIGTGKIGECFAQICKGFGMNILCYDTKVSKEVEQLFGGKYVGLETLFKESDVISLHCPLTPQSVSSIFKCFIALHIINYESISLMNKQPIILNTGRGALIETKSVIRALRNLKISGLGIDVYEQEEKIFFKDQSSTVMTDDNLARLLSFNNVIVTGHQAFFTKEALMNICKTTIQNIIEIKTKGSCDNEVQYIE